MFLTTHYMDEAEYCDRIGSSTKDLSSRSTRRRRSRLRWGPTGSRSRRMTTSGDRGAARALRSRRVWPKARSRSASPRASSSCRAVRARPADPLGERRAPLARRRVSLLHGQDDPRRRGLGPETRRNFARMMSADGDRGGNHARRRAPSRWRAGGRAGARARAQLRQRATRDQGRLKRELIRFRSDRLRILTSLTQPFLFLFILGTGLSRSRLAARTASTSKPSCTPRAVHAVMFTAMFSAASIVWDREFGFLREMMVGRCAQLDRAREVPRRCHRRGFQGLIVIRSRVSWTCRTARVAARDLWSAAAARVRDHGLRHDGRRAHEPDAVVMAVMQMAIMPMFFISGALFRSQSCRRG